MRSKESRGFLYSLPMILWLTFLFVLPTLIIIGYSFLKRDIYGGVIYEFSMDSFRSLLQPSFWKVIFKTLWIALLSTVITVSIGIPSALYIARSKRKNLLLLLIIVPFWTNFLIRIYSWQLLLGERGFLNEGFIFIRNLLGIDIFAGAPYQLLYRTSAVVVVIIYAYLPYAIMPLFSSMEKFDFSLIEASRDLGATKVESYFKVFLPCIKNGINTAFLFTFIPALGSYAIPQIVGGNSSVMLGTVIAKELTTNRNFPRGAAISTILIIFTLIFITFFNRDKKVTQ